DASGAVAAAVADAAAAARKLRRLTSMAASSRLVVRDEDEYDIRRPGWASSGHEAQHAQIGPLDSHRQSAATPKGGDGRGPEPPVGQTCILAEACLQAESGDSRHETAGGCGSPNGGIPGMATNAKWLIVTLPALALLLATASSARAAAPPSQPGAIGRTPPRLSYINGEVSFWGPGDQEARHGPGGRHRPERGSGPRRRNCAELRRPRTRRLGPVELRAH